MPEPRDAAHPRVVAVGASAVLAEVPDLEAVAALDAALRPLVEAGAGPWGAVTDVVPAARTVLVVLRDGAPLAPVLAAVEEVARRERGPAAGGGHPASGVVVEVPVHYEGPDLEAVAAHTGLTPAEVVAAHTGMPWRVAFGGFAPGFAYLVGGDPRLVVPRRESPRARVPTGAVGLAGEFSGVYPRASPGGWQLVGTTDLVLWDVDRDPPALLRPGVVVRFVEVGR